MEGGCGGGEGTTEGAVGPGGVGCVGEVWVGALVDEEAGEGGVAAEDGPGEGGDEGGCGGVFGGPVGGGGEGFGVVGAGVEGGGEGGVEAAVGEEEVGEGGGGEVDGYFEEELGGEVEERHCSSGAEGPALPGRLG